MLLSKNTTEKSGDITNSAGAGHGDYRNNNFYIIFQSLYKQSLFGDNDDINQLTEKIFTDYSKRLTLLEKQKVGDNNPIAKNEFYQPVKVKRVFREWELEDVKEEDREEYENQKFDIEEEFADFLSSEDRILFIEGSPGSGKTMFSESVCSWRKELLGQGYPKYFPIYIRLRDYEEVKEFFARLKANDKYFLVDNEAKFNLNNFISHSLLNYTEHNKKRLAREYVRKLLYTDDTCKTKNIGEAFDLTDELFNIFCKLPTKVVLVFDGLDELILSSDKNFSSSLDFVEQVNELLTEGELENENIKAIITGRPMGLISVEEYKKTAEIKDSLWKAIRWLKIQPFEEKEILKWAEDWDSLILNKKQSAYTFLKKLFDDKNRKEELLDVIGEPLVLFHTSNLIHSGDLDFDKFKQSNNFRLAIYEQLTFETLQKRDKEDKKLKLDQKLTNLTVKDRYIVLHKLATCIFNHNGTDSNYQFLLSKLENIYSEENSKKSIKEAIEEFDNELKRENQNLDEDYLDNIFTFFYLDHDKNSGSVEFAHKSFGEFLQAREIWQTLFDLKKLIATKFNYNENISWEDINQKEEEQGEKSSTQQKDKEAKEKQEKVKNYIYQTLYNLLSGRAMTEKTIVYDFWRQMLEVAMEDVKKDGGFFIKKQDIEKVEKEQTLDLEKNYPKNINQFYSQFLTADYLFIFQALESFYHKWSNRGFINELPTKNFIFKHQKSISKFYKDQELESLQTLKIDITTGVNVLLILLEFDRKNKLGFTLFSNLGCLKLTEKSYFKQSQSYIESFELGYNEYLNRNLNCINLDDVHLNRADLINSNLTETKLIEANLSMSNLSLSELINADLTSADLSRADLIGANLRNADLNRADLTNANFREADFQGTKNLKTTKNFKYIQIWTRPKGNRTDNPWWILNLNINNLPPEAQKMMREWQQKNKQEF